MVDFDNVFKYATPKYVYIRDAKLGILKYTLMILIFVYVVVYDIFMECSHLKPHAAMGFGQIETLQPQDKCNQFASDCMAEYDVIDSLEYCEQYKPKPTTTKAATQSTTTEEAKTTTEEAKKTTEKSKTEAGGSGDGSRRMKSDEANTEEDGKDDKASATTAGSGKSGPDHPPIGEFISDKKTCRYFDSMRLQWAPAAPSEVFVPTRYKSISQHVSPHCYDPKLNKIIGAEGGRSKFKCEKPWLTHSVEDYYVADIGDFDLMITHSFNSPATGLFGTSKDYQGFFAACKSNEPMTPNMLKKQCKRMKIPNSVGDVASEDDVGLTTPEDEGVPSLRGTSSGKDTITLQDLLKLTPIAQRHGLDKNILDARLPDAFGHPGKSMRERGGMLVLEVDYANTGAGRPGFPFLPHKSFGVKPITYTYRPSFVPINENVKYQLLQEGDYPRNRTVDVWYGITIKMAFNGQLVKFQFAKVLSALTTGLVLITMATTIVTALASYVLPLAEKYCLLMYQLSEDFSDYKELHAKNPDFPSEYWVGDKLLEKLDAGGNGKLEDDEILGMFATTEMRLNRLDGMDPKVVFEEGDEMHNINYKIGDYAAAFYKKNIGGDLKHMSYKLQGERRQKITGTSGQKCGKLD